MPDQLLEGKMIAHIRETAEVSSKVVVYKFFCMFSHDEYIFDLFGYLQKKLI